MSGVNEGNHPLFPSCCAGRHPLRGQKTAFFGPKSSADHKGAADRCGSMSLIVFGFGLISAGAAGPLDTRCITVTRK